MSLKKEVYLDAHKVYSDQEAFYEFRLSLTEIAAHRELFFVPLGSMDFVAEATPPVCHSTFMRGSGIFFPFSDTGEGKLRLDKGALLETEKHFLNSFALAVYFASLPPDPQRKEYSVTFRVPVDPLCQNTESQNILP